MARGRRVYSGSTDLRNRRITVYRSPRMIVEFELDRRGIAKIAMGQDLKDACRQVVTGRAMPFAIRNSPHGETLEYVSSWRAAEGHTIIAGMRRVACKLINVAPHAAAVEWGRGGRRGVLGKTLAHLNATSGVVIQGGQLRKAWDPQLHPRGPGGRFISKQR